MTSPRSSLAARIVLVAAFTLVLLVVLVPGAAHHLDTLVRHGAASLRRFGHGLLTLDDGFVLAAAVAAVTMSGPMLVAEASSVSRPLRTVGATSWTALGAVSAIVWLSLWSATPSSTARSLALAVVVGLVLGSLLLAALRTLRATRVTAPRATGRSRVVAAALGLVTIAGIGVVGFAGSPVDAGSRGLLEHMLAALHRRGLPEWFGYSATEFTANVAFFMPLGLLLVLFFGARWWWVAAFLGSLASATIEAGQAMFLPARFASVDDVLANTSGAAIGAGVGVVLLGWAARRRSRR